MNIKSIYYEITSQCNSQCIYCYNNSSSSGVNLDYDLVVNTIEEAHFLGAESIVFSGGEPSLHPRLADLVRMSKKIGYCSIGVLTNGSGFNDYQLQVIKDSNCYIQISCDSSDPEVLSVLRPGIPLSKLTKTCKQLSDINIEVSLRCTINKMNAYSLEELIDFAKRLKIKTVSFSWMMIAGRALNNVEKTALSHDDIQYVVNKTKQLEASLGDQIRIVPINIPLCEMRYFLNPEYNIHITSMGDVHLCSGLKSKEYIVGNIHTKSLKTIFQSKHVSTKKKVLESYYKKYCSNCSTKAYCGGICPAFLTSDNKISAFCQYTRKMYQQLVSNL